MGVYPIEINGCLYGCGPTKILNCSMKSGCTVLFAENQSKHISQCDGPT